jgi:hypothetical protein
MMLEILKPSRLKMPDVEVLAGFWRVGKPAFSENPE